MSDNSGIKSKLTAHNRDVLNEADLITRIKSNGDGRRRHVRLDHDAVESLVAS